MSFRTKYNLWKIQRAISPSAKFKKGLHLNLDTAWNARYGKPSWIHSGLLQRVGAVAVVALVLVGSGGAYAYSSPEVTEGSPLYPIKKTLEKVEEVTKLTPEAKAQFYLKKIERREAEKLVLEEKGKLLKISRGNKDDEEFESELEDEQATSTDDNQPDRKDIKIRMIRAERSIEEAEDRLEKFSEDIKKIEMKASLKPELKEKIEQRLEKRRQKLERFEQKIDERKEKIEENQDKFKEVRETVEDRSGSGKDRERVELKRNEVEDRD